MILYKYIRAVFGYQAIQSCKIRFTQLSALNDPFESHPSVERVYSDDEFTVLLERLLFDPVTVDSLVSETADRLYSRLPSDLQLRMSSGAFAQLLLSKISAVLQQHGKTPTQFMRELAHSQKDSVIAGARAQLPEIVAQTVGVLSLTTSPTNELMWASYADQHRGVLLGFKSEYSLFAHAFPIVYSRQRPSLDMNTLPDNESEWFSSIQVVCGTKNEVWSHEQEYRVALPVGALEKGNTLDTQGNPIYFAQFPISALTEVIMGHRIVGDDSQRIRTELSTARCSHIKVRCANLDHDDRRILINDCP